MNLIEAREMALEEMAKHNLLGEEPAWTFRWSNAKTFFGTCNYTRRTISLSRPLTVVNSDEVVLDVILHEIAHALTGPGFGHGFAWQRRAASIGARPERCWDIGRRDIVHFAPAKWIGICPKCGHQINKHRLTRRAKSIACKSCCREYNGGKWSIDYLFQWRQML